MISVIRVDRRDDDKSVLPQEQTYLIRRNEGVSHNRRPSVLMDGIDSISSLGVYDLEIPSGL